MFHRFCAALLAVMSASSPVFAWNDAGHKMVCRVAWDQLMDTPEAQVKELLGVTTEQEFADTCAWADAHRAEHPETASWHEVFVPKSAREVDMARDCPESTSCVLREIERNLAILKSGAPREERATALKFLAHFVGDAHQPLRVAFAEDRGGAGIGATFLGRPTNLRAIWDSGLLDTDPAGLEALASTYHLYTPLDRLFVDWIADLPAQWATESLWIMRTPATGYVGNPGGLSFDQTYVKQNILIAHDRIAKAGMRLGHLLNEAFRPAIPE
ncbi:MAG: S1/P1 nuclease [Rhodospirillaceae bacterium]